MRNFLLFCLALVLVLMGTMTLGYLPRGLTALSDVGIERAANLISVESTDNNAVEQDGISFEIIVPQRVWIIPENKPDAATKVLIGMRIINQTRTPLRFSRFFSMIPQFVGTEGQFLQRDGGRDSMFPPRECDYPLVIPGQGVSFFLHGRLVWRNNKLQVAFDDGFNGVIGFNDLKPGSYQLRFVYANSSTTAKAYDQDIVLGRTVEGFWTGEVFTPFVEVRLVHP